MEDENQTTEAPNKGYGADSITVLGGLDAVKVLITTVKEQSKDIYSAFSTGCESYLIKPFTKKHLFKEIEKLGIKIPHTS